MNTIEEILKSKLTIEQEYVKEICKECENKDNNKDLCNITRTIDNAVKCVNYERCMKNKCNTCTDNKKCWTGTTARKHKAIMKGII